MLWELTRRKNDIPQHLHLFLTLRAGLHVSVRCRVRSRVTGDQQIQLSFVRMKNFGVSPEELVRVPEELDL